MAKDVIEEGHYVKPDYWNMIHFKAIVGSHAYGLNVETSDEDYRGFFAPPTQLILGAQSYESVPQTLENQQEEDTAYWEFGHYLHQAIRNNPNILEPLWSHQMYFPCDYSTDMVMKLIANRRRFLNNRLIKTYGGYATSQWDRGMRMYANNHPQAWKHFMHLCRLLITGAEALRTGDIRLNLSEYRDKLLSIRRGEWDLDKVEYWHAELEADFMDAQTKSVLPELPDLKWINDYQVEFRIHLLNWKP